MFLEDARERAFGACPGMTMDVIHRPCSLCRPRAGPLRELQFPSPIEGSGAPAGAGACEAPGGRSAKHARWDVLRSVPFLRCEAEERAFRRSTAAFLRRAGRAFENVDQPRLSASSWRQVVMPASGAPPSPERFGIRFSEARGAASTDGGVSPVIDPARSWAHLRPSLTAAPSSRRPMTTPLEEQDKRLYA